MKNLLVLAALGALGYYGYQEWFAKPEPKPAAVEVPQNAAIKPVAPPGAQRIEPRVRRMYEEWKDRAIATPKIQQASRRTDLATTLTEIRAILGEDFGVHSPEAVKEVILYCLPVPDSEKAYVYGGIVAEANRDAQVGGHNRAN